MQLSTSFPITPVIISKYTTSVAKTACCVAIAQIAIESSKAILSNPLDEKFNINFSICQTSVFFLNNSHAM
jgi:hypothetical protein